MRKRPDGVTIVPRIRDHTLVGDVTGPDTVAATQATLLKSILNNFLIILCQLLIRFPEHLGLKLLISSRS